MPYTQQDRELLEGAALKSNLEVSLRAVVAAMNKLRVTVFTLEVDGVSFTTHRTRPLSSQPARQALSGQLGSIYVLDEPREPGEGE
jgi:hypothetical protein